MNHVSTKSKLLILTAVICITASTASPAFAVTALSDDNSQSSVAGVTYTVAPVDSHTLAVSFELGSALKIVNEANVVSISDSRTGEASQLPTTFQVDANNTIIGTWQLLGDSRLLFHITGSSSAQNIVGFGHIRQARAANYYWNCVTKGLQGGAIGGAIAAVPAGPGGMGLGLVFGGLGGSIAAAVTCR